MLEVAILGFLMEEPQHGYELKQRIAMLTGHAYRVSDGALYPAISRMEKKGWVVRRQQPGEAAAPRQVLSLTPEGAAQLLRMLRNPSELEISNSSQFNIILAFAKYLEPKEQRAVLQRRLAFLEAAPGFFQAKGKPVRLAGETDPFRRGMLHLAISSSREERAWLRKMIDDLGESNRGKVEEGQS